MDIITDETKVRLNPDEPVLGTNHPWGLPSRFAALVIEDDEGFSPRNYDAMAFVTSDIGAAYDLFNKLYTGFTSEEFQEQVADYGSCFIAMYSIDADSQPSRFESPRYLVIAADESGDEIAQGLLYDAYPDAQKIVHAEGSKIEP